MAKIISYVVVEAADAHELTEKVCNMIEEGWALHGSMGVEQPVYLGDMFKTTRAKFFQPMVYRRKDVSYGDAFNLFKKGDENGQE